MPLLDNGDVIPSFLSVDSTPGFDTGTYFNNINLIRGEVVKIVYPDSKESQSKKYIEYDVYIENRKDGTSNGELLNHVLMWNPLGQQSDSSAWTLRAASEQPWSKKEAMSDGSKVLIMFLHGDGRKPYIIGGLRDINDKNDPGDLKKEAGHYYTWLFNGVSILVDDDGAFKLAFNGPTKNDGKLDTDKVKDEATGTYLEINKDGNAKLATKDDKQFININHKDKKILIQQDEALEIGEATDKMLLGESFRNAQKELDNKVKANVTTAKNLIQQAGTQLQTAGGSVVGPFLSAAAGTQITAAGALLLSAANALNQVAQAFDDFEQAAAKKDSFLSRKNSSD